jgi:DNA-binding IclR family transcriptional regulator
MELLSFAVGRCVTTASTGAEDLVAVDLHVAPAMAVRRVSRMGRRGSTIRLVDKASQLIERLAEKGEASPAELARDLGEPRSSAYRLIEALTRIGIVRPALNGKVELGVGLLHLGAAAADAVVERRAALPAMAGLHARTGETVYLCVRRGMEAVCVERAEGRRVGLLLLQPGGSLPLHAGGAPRVLLAYEPELWDAYCDRDTFRAFTPKTLQTADELRADLEQIRATGFAVSDEDVTPGVAAIGAPVLDASGRVRASLSVAGLRHSILSPEAAMAQAVLNAAREVERALAAAR